MVQSPLQPSASMKTIDSSAFMETPSTCTGDEYISQPVIQIGPSVCHTVEPQQGRNSCLADAECNIVLQTTKVQSHTSWG